MNESALDERLVVAAITLDAAAARELLAPTLEEARKRGSQAAQEERSVRALVAVAEKQPAEALKYIEPVTFDTSQTEEVVLWSIVKLQSGGSGVRGQRARVADVA